MTRGFLQERGHPTLSQLGAAAQKRAGTQTAPIFHPQDLLPHQPVAQETYSPDSGRAP